MDAGLEKTRGAGSARGSGSTRARIRIDPMSLPIGQGLADAGDTECEGREASASRGTGNDRTPFAAKTKDSFEAAAFPREGNPCLGRVGQLHGSVRPPGRPCEGSQRPTFFLVASSESGVARQKCRLAASRRRAITFSHVSAGARLRIPCPACCVETKRTRIAVARHNIAFCFSRRPSASR